mgnify:CR=1 FL=1
MDNTPDSPAKTPVGYTTQGGNFWTLITPEIWKVLHAVLQIAPRRALLAGVVLVKVSALPNKEQWMRRKGIEPGAVSGPVQVTETPSGPTLLLILNGIDGKLTQTLLANYPIDA